MNVSKMIPLALVLGASIGLNGCLPMVLGGAAAGIAVSGADRRTTSAQVGDEVTELRLKNKIQAEWRKQNAANSEADISVLSYNRHVLLLGYAPDEAAKQLAESLAKSENDVVKVHNYIHVGSRQGFGDISNDAWVTSKVRASLLNMSGVYSGHVKVITYAGTTYVLGLLTPEQQQVVNARVSTTAGVQRVVTLYQPYH